MNLQGMGRRFAGVLALGTLALFSLGNDQGGCVGGGLPIETEPQCRVPSDCEGLPHVLCEGAWQCVEGQCGWKCGEEPPPPPECNVASDCTGEPAVDCLGGWQCLEGQCNWKCGEVPPECTTAKDCEAYPAPYKCLGAWECLAGQCQYQCGVPPVCQVSGCSGEICAAESLASDCVWLDWYKCLQYSTCGNFGPGGGCGWEPTQAYQDCLNGNVCTTDADCPEGYYCAGVVPPVPCADGEYCDALIAAPTCLPKQPDPSCASDADCPKGQTCQEVSVCPDCVYAGTCKIACQVVFECRPVQPTGCYSNADCPEGTHCSVSDGACGVDPACPECAVCRGECVPNDPAQCVVSGCSGQVCAPVPVATTCEWLDWYKCLALTTCGGFGPGGSCAWEPNDAFLACLNGGQCQSDADCPTGQACVFHGGCPPCACDATDPACTCPACMPPLYGTCVPACQATPELCDGVDNDCDGAVDEGCPVPNGCDSDADCLPGLHCELLYYADPAKMVPIECCPINAFCAPEIPPCGGGTCVLDAGRCWGDGDCAPLFACEGARICPPGALCILPDAPGTCRLGAVGCMDDSQCRAGEFCPIVLSSEQCCPMNAKCLPGVPPCLCRLLPDRCWVDADCKEGRTCEGARVCPPNALCFAADQAGTCKDPAPSGCFADSDCAVGEVCEVPPSTDPTTCCLPDQVCLMIYPPCEGVCVPAPTKCQVDADCGDGRYCSYGDCRDIPAGACLDSTDCSYGAKCEMMACPLCVGCPCLGRCTSGLAFGQCWADSDCTPGSYCEVLKCGDERCVGPYACLPRI